MAPADPTDAARSRAAGTQRRARVMVVHGPNLDLLGEREPGIYGDTSLAELDARLVALGHELGVAVECAQSNAEGTLIDLLHRARRECDAVVINPGGYTHTSVALHDALRALAIPAVEVHLSNLYVREPMRQRSVTAAACRGVIMGLGLDSYLLALRHVVALAAEHAARAPEPAISRGAAPSTTHATTTEPA
ncbi:MAG: type II 3-dehydroquinate dehydratase [Deltaproteobacteria bacterium]|nr:type II 3-dehydroquinate dehydratase [Deltaproteobacteria bacterium]MBK8239050.1 type II 3-dehydroquinate dehydratase [Deltaproteobacteria bacterium]MBK8717560.1 type II 3-dehydroquinate dehydratase [Deltaproteobacteria bacterium]MBP7285832.1 type II 3-dehydroquinate dehydratase [Nannocystaceae bacterium]